MSAKRSSLQGERRGKVGGGGGGRHQRDAATTWKVSSGKASACLYRRGGGRCQPRSNSHRHRAVKSTPPAPVLAHRLTTAITSSAQTMSDFEHPRASETVNKEAATESADER